MAALRDVLDSGRRAVLVTQIDGDGMGAVGLLDSSGGVVSGALPAETAVSAANEVLIEATPRIVESGERSWFLEPVLPAPRLIVLGAVSAADALVPMARAAGYAVHLIDPRDWLATADRYPDAASVRCGRPDEMLGDMGIDASTSVVSFLHDAWLEDDVLTMALTSPARYVGSMGSRKSSEAKIARLRRIGLDDSSVARLHAPIGIDIGSRSPQEMAVSILAQVVAAGRGRV